MPRTIHETYGSETPSLSVADDVRVDSLRPHDFENATKGASDNVGTVSDIDAPL